MNEIDARNVWDAMPWPQRAALEVALVPRPVYEVMRRKWIELDGDTQKQLLKLDWNFMLGGKLGR